MLISPLVSFILCCVHMIVITFFTDRFHRPSFPRIRKSRQNITGIVPGLYRIDIGNGCTFVLVRSPDRLNHSCCFYKLNIPFTINPFCINTMELRLWCCENHRFCSVFGKSYRHIFCNKSCGIFLCRILGNMS